MRLLFPVIALSFSGLLGAADKISTATAKDHLDQTATVCGKVVGTRYLDQSANKFTFLNFDKAYPDSPFTAIIPGENRAKFGEPEKTYLEKNICVTGKIVEYNKKPEIVLTDPNQVKVEAPTNRNR